MEPTKELVPPSAAPLRFTHPADKVAEKWRLRRVDADGSERSEHG